MPGACSPSAERAKYSAEDDSACRAERETERDADAYRDPIRAGEQDADHHADAAPNADEDA